MTFEEFYQERRNLIPWDWKHNPKGFPMEKPPGSKEYGDIAAHMPMLEFLASHCDHVSEFGCCRCISTAAMIHGKPNEFVGYDCQMWPDMIQLSNIEDLPCEFKITQCYTEDPKLEFEPTDFLFIDSLHTYEQKKAELRFANQVSKYIGFHDTYSEGYAKPNNGIVKAIDELISDSNGEWKKVYEVTFNHGLIILERSK